MFLTAFFKELYINFSAVTQIGRKLIDKDGTSVFDAAPPDGARDEYSVSPLLLFVSV